MINLFIAEHFPENYKLLKEKGIDLKFLGFDDNLIKNLILMCKFFSNWLFHKKYTEYRMEINVDF